jgi:heme A synthase
VLDCNRMNQIHHILADMTSIYSLVMGAWGLFNFLRRKPPDGNYNGALALAVGLYFIEGLVGLILVFMGQMPARGIHFLYGVTIMITIPAIFFFTRGSNTSRESLFYGLGMVFIWGLSERASITGTGSGF